MSDSSFFSFKAAMPASTDFVKLEKIAEHLYQRFKNKSYLDIYKKVGSAVTKVETYDLEDSFWLIVHDMVWGVPKMVAIDGGTIIKDKDENIYMGKYLEWKYDLPFLGHLDEPILPDR